MLPPRREIQGTPFSKRANHRMQTMQSHLYEHAQNQTTNFYVYMHVFKLWIKKLWLEQTHSETEVTSE